MKKPYLMPVVYITQKCNLNCKYCYVKKYNKTMSWKTAKRTIDFLGSLDYERRVLAIFGGEPMIEWELFKRIVDYTEKTNKFSDIFLCTNGTLLDKEKIEYFVEHKISPQISLDGIATAHDANRVNKFNEGSFRCLDENLRLIGRKYINKMKDLHLRLTITPQNIPYLIDTIKYIISINLLKAQINLFPEVHIKYSNSDFSNLKEQFKGITELAKQIKNYKNGNLKLHYNECLSKRNNFESFDNPNCRVFCRLADQMLSVDIEGNVYACYIAAGISKNKSKALKLGTIYEGLKYPSRLIDLDYSNPFNPYLSCLVWNYEKNGKLLKSISIYKKIYNVWINAYNLFWDKYDYI